MRSSLYPDDAAKLGKAPDKPEGAKWADPLTVIDAVTYRADGAGYLPAGYEQVFWVPADGGAPTQLTFGATNAGGPVSWTPDGRSILFSANLSKDWEREPVNSEIYRIGIDGGAPVALTDRYGPDAGPVVSPDGRHIAYVGFDDKHLGYQNTRLYVMNPDGSGKRMLTGSLDRSVGSPAWGGDNAIYVQVEDGGVMKVSRVGLDGSIREVASGMGGAELDRPYTGGRFSVARDGSIALMGGSASRPPDVVLVRGGQRRALTRLNAELLGRKRLGEVRLYRVPIAVTVAARSQKQIALLEQPSVKVSNILRLTVGTGLTQAPLQRVLVTRNRESEGLGLPLPAGKVALFGLREGRRILLGEGTIDDYTIGEKVEIPVATATGVWALQKPYGGGYLLTLTNDLSKPQTVEIQLPLDARGKELVKRDGAMLWRVTVPANGTSEVRYRLRS